MVFCTPSEKVSPCLQNLIFRKNTPDSCISDKTEHTNLSIVFNNKNKYLKSSKKKIEICQKEKIVNILRLNSI